jgi:hypothetical protein
MRVNQKAARNSSIYPKADEKWAFLNASFQQPEEIKHLSSSTLEKGHLTKAIAPKHSNLNFPTL